LVSQNFRTDDIAHLLGVTGQRITNVKAELNMLLFGKKAAKELQANMQKQYGIFPL
jgi:transcription antitermination factor NusA-like protein